MLSGEAEGSCLIAGQHQARCAWRGSPGGAHLAGLTWWGSPGGAPLAGLPGGAAGVGALAPLVLLGMRV